MEIDSRAGSAKAVQSTPPAHRGDRDPSGPCLEVGQGTWGYGKKGKGPMTALGLESLGNRDP
jgi:hypothetical protein